MAAADTTASVNPVAVEEPTERDHVRFLLALAALAGSALWLIPIASSFWLDEAGTYWIVKGDASTTIHRATTYAGLGPLYYVIPFLSKALPLPIEVALRLPSVLAAAASAWLIFALVRRLFGPQAAALATVVYVTLPGVAFAAADARPYAWGLLALTGSSLLAVRYVDRGTPGGAIAWGSVAGIAFHLQYLFAAAILGQVIFMTFEASRRRAYRLLFLPLGSLVVFCAPALPTIRSLIRRSDELSVPSTLTVQSMLSILVPSVVVGALVAGIFVARAVGPLAIRSAAGARSAIVLACALWLSPPLTLGFVTLAVTPVLVDRYYLPMAIGIALLAGWLISSVSPTKAQRMIAVTFAAVMALTGMTRLHGSEDWRGASAIIDSRIDSPATLVLYHAAFIEAAQVDSLGSPEQEAYLNAPISAYPIAGDVVAVPYYPTTPAREYVDGVLRSKGAAHDQIFFVTRYEQFLRWAPWLEARLAPLGFTARRLDVDLGEVSIFEFTRPRDRG